MARTGDGFNRIGQIDIGRRLGNVGLIEIALREQVAKAGMAFDSSIEFGQSYSETLRKWYVDFNDRWDDIATLGFDDRFRRMWNMYLTSCASGFQSGNCDVTQITVRRPA